MIRPAFVLSLALTLWAVAPFPVLAHAHGDGAHEDGTHGDAAHDTANAPGTPDPHPHVPASLKAHTDEFRKEIIEVTDGVYLAVGYGLANSAMIVGEDGVFIVDVMESVEEAQAVWADFQKLTDKPISALVYTHNHADHTYGGLGFVPDGDVPVYAHATTEYYINRVLNIIRPAIATRSSRMFGTYLEVGDTGFVNAGIGPRLGIGGNSTNAPGIIRPTLTFEDRLETTIAGVEVEMVHAPGETNDQIFIWIPSKKLLLPGDNIYRTFPNLYTIRGTPYRDVTQWVESLDKMIALEPEFIAPGHTRPLKGKEFIRETLTAYRDAIQYVHDQTIRGINKGLTPDELVEFVKLPEHLGTHPFLLEHYGTVEWSVRSIYAGYLGWFNGDAADLSRPPPAERSKAITDLAGGPVPALEAAKEALENGQHKWAAELAGHVLRASPTLVEAAQVKASALRALGYASTSPNGRNYYLTQARELEGDLLIDGNPPISAETVAFIQEFPISSILAAMPVNLVPEKALKTDTVMGFRFTDTEEAFTIHVRRGVAAFSEGWPEKPDVGVETTTKAWIDVVTRRRSLPLLLATLEVRVPTGITTVPRLLQTLAMFRED